MKRGMTLLELMVGLVTAAIIAGVCAKVLQLGIMTYNYSVRQNESLTRTRKAMAGDGARFGVLWAGRGANSFSGISASSVAVVSSSASVVTEFYVTGGNLYRTMSGTTILQADAVTALALNYYNVDSSGLIMQSTTPALATMATAIVTVKGNSNSQKTYTLFSGAKLRNHP
jgi:prepilin-type N-terminal cleavage/methylation domain-containing protein